ncbi:hypothetical protein C8F04DRAFT_568043 [Mycena alexandri]|uniref:Uncharacterized protein n=1 Tax=Mycena alexandri TaxID=1745969 RepID=A0AAD6SWX8_9AGAR|nr:hypothetical protein C8F04DRAFT_568043 [Mycena alexandri]
MDPSVSLPQELWLYIHRLATADTSPMVAAYTDRYQYVAVPNPLDDMQDFLHDVSSFALVSRLWNGLTREILYENIRVDGRFHALYAALERPGTARLVRSVCLSTTRFDHNKAILALCPQLQIVVQPEASTTSRSQALVGALGLDLNVTIPNFDCLKHIYWTHSDVSLNLLLKLISLAPNLEYLFVQVSETLRSEREFDFPALPALQRLTLGPLHPTLIVSIFLQLDVTTLTRLHCIPTIFKFPEIPTLPSLQTLELFGSRSTIPFNLIFFRCPRLRELRYDVWNGILETWPDGLRTAPLPCIRLHSAVAFRDWTSTEAIEAHFSLFLSPKFPRVQRLVLHNSWHQIVNKPWFTPYRDGLRELGCRLEFSEGNVL